MVATVELEFIWNESGESGNFLEPVLKHLKRALPCRQGSFRGIKPYEFATLAFEMAS